MQWDLVPEAAFDERLRYALDHDYPVAPSIWEMSVVRHSEEPPRLTVLPPKEALRRARPLPSDDEMTIEGLTQDEWRAFEQALAER